MTTHKQRDSSYNVDKITVVPARHYSDVASDRCQQVTKQKRRAVPESYVNATYEVGQRQGLIERECMGSGSNVMEQQLCDQRRQIVEKHWLKEL